LISVTLDSNVYISALNYGGAPLQLLEMARAGQIRLDLSNAILEEVGGVLRDKFHWPEEDIGMAQREIASFANQVSPQGRVLAVSADPDDDRILECAAEANSDYVVTGDKDLLRLGSYGPMRIVKVADMLNILRGPGRRSPRR
jgi:putative PIN family toxin of toxin-antitoxin system